MVVGGVDVVEGGPVGPGGVVDDDVDALNLLGMAPVLVQSLLLQSRVVLGWS